MASEIEPPYAQMQVDPATSTGAPPAMVCGAIGIHGAGTAGTHGIGVNTPRAAAVAAATMGLANDWHMPNGAMFAPGAISVMVATGRPSTIGRGATTERVEGARPNVHMIIAPETAQGLPIAGHHRVPLTELDNSSPVVVTKQVTVRSSDSCHPRADGIRKV